MKDISLDQRQLILDEIKAQKLPQDFINVVSDFYQPLAEGIVNKANHNIQANYFFLGVQGTQGSGKSTCAQFLKLIFESLYAKKTLVISIDDFYLTRAERQELASDIHPLFETRGVPGTHDLVLLQQVLRQCDNFQQGNLVSVPTFDKSLDDRAAFERWQTISQPVDIIILEGWCVGLTSQAEEDLDTPVNQLEAQDDAGRIWRDYVNQQLTDIYAQLYAQLDGLVALQAPSFDCVFQWRLLQEQKLAHKLKDAGLDASKVQSEQQLRRFISHYERLTKHALQTMPKQADWLLLLKKDHGFSKFISKHSQ